MGIGFGHPCVAVPLMPAVAEPVVGNWQITENVGVVGVNYEEVVTLLTVTAVAGTEHGL